MKLRDGFVSNSSSCSFIVKPRNALENLFLKAAREIAVADLGEEAAGDAMIWSVIYDPEKKTYLFDTTINNFDLLGYLEDQGFDILQREYIG